MSLRLKTILGVGLIEAILLAVLITTVLNYMRLSNEENLENYVSTTTTLFATTTKDAVLSFDLASLENFVEEILKNQGVLYARILDADNNILASGGDSKRLQKPFIVDRNYKDVNDAIYDAEELITVDDIIYGRIEVGISTEQIEKAILQAKKLAAAIAALEMLLVALFSFALGIYLTKQLKVLQNSARSIAAGDLDHEIEIKTHDEIGEVADSFNKMIASLNAANKKSQQYHKELVDLNKSLEDRVERRTKKILDQKDKLETAYEKLQKTQQQLVQSEKMASIGQLAAGVAHEINNPVAFIKSNLSSLTSYIKTYQEIIEKQQSLISSVQTLPEEEINTQIEAIKEFWEEEDIDFINEDIETLVKESIDGTHRVTEIVKGLKVYSRASDETMEECDLSTCLQDTLKMLNNELKYSCEVITKIEPSLITNCDRSKITQVFTNLIVNAVQAMETKGTLTLEAFHDESASEKMIIVKISDTGKGIPEENLSKLFDPFFTTKPVGEGTGLGLSISQGIIEDHNGKMTVESEVNKGTCFTISLP